MEKTLSSQKPVLPRTRHACDPCRRKKSKCSGDRPSCSTCTRLRQQCSWPAESDLTDDDAQLQGALYIAGQADRPAHVRATSLSNDGLTSQRRLEERMHSIETTLTRVLDTLHSVTAAGTLHALSTQQTTQQPTAPAPQTTKRAFQNGLDDVPPPSAKKRREDGQLPLWTQVQDVADIYLKYCDGQPLYLFHKDTFTRSLKARPDDLLLAILALTLRFRTPHSPEGHSVNMDEGQLLAKRAHALVLAKIATRAIDLSTLQTLCLLAFLHFHDGSSDRSMPFVTLSTALTYGLSLQLDSPSTPAPILEERRRTYWSIRLLCRFWGLAPSTFELPGSQILISTYPLSPLTPPVSAIRPECRSLYEPRRHGTAAFALERGIMSEAYQLGEVWSQAMIFIRHRFSALSSDEIRKRSAATTAVAGAPWETTSEYNRAMSTLMGFDRHLPPLHRYRHLNWTDLTADDLDHTHRHYWAPWLLTRFMYHTIICILNHPLLVTLQLQGKGNDSELFRQQTSFYISVHTSWIMYFIKLIRLKKGFVISDPTLGYCAAVVATIELQLSFSAPTPSTSTPGGGGAYTDDTGEWQTSSSPGGHARRQNFEQCLQFVRDMSRQWPSMKSLAQKLEALTDSISVSYESMTQLDTGGNIHVDISKVSDILDFAAAGTSAVGNMAGQNGGGSGGDRGGTSAAQWTTLVQPPQVDQPDHASAVDFSSLLLNADAAATTVPGGGVGGGTFNANGMPQTTFGSSPGQGGMNPVAAAGGGTGMDYFNNMGLSTSSGTTNLMPADMFFNIGEVAAPEASTSWGAFGGF